MRVAHVITRMIVGGAQENTLLNCQDLIRIYGDEVLLITGPALGPEGDLLAQSGGGGVPVKLIPSLRRAIHPIRDATSYRAIRQCLRDFRPDVVHTHSAKGGVLGRMAAWSLKVPAIVHTVHGAPFHAYQSAIARKVFQACERYAARRCHRLISVADAMTDLMVEARVAPRDQFTTVYSGMEVEPFLNANSQREQVRRELGFAKDDFVIGKIARLFHLKGHEYVLEAARQLVSRHPQVRLLFVGDGILRERFESEIRGTVLEGKVRFTGLVPPSRVPAMISAMDALVHASLREGLARALPQTLLAGKPVVSFDIDGAREVCRSGETGFLVPACDTAALMQAMERLVADPALCEQLGRAGRALCEPRFRHESMTAQLRDIYGTLLRR